MSHAIPCPCGGGTEVIDSRPVQFNGQPTIRRRRRCVKCGGRFNTYEVFGDDANELTRGSSRVAINLRARLKAMRALLDDMDADAKERPL